jgi:hypothetical protein
MRLAVAVVLSLVLAGCGREPAPPAAEAAPAKVAAPAAAPTLEMMRIDDAWMGLGGPDKLRSVIVRNPAGEFVRVGHHAWFDADAGANREERIAAARVPAEKLQALVAAISLPPRKRDDLFADWTSPAWLAENASGAYDTLPTRSPPCPESARALFSQRFADPMFAREALAAMYAGKHTDDYPSLVVTLVFSDRTQRKLKTSGQSDGMLPFAEAGRDDAWEPAIAEAVAALMPPESPNVGRLRGRPHAVMLASAVREHIDPAAWQVACP